MFHPCFYYSHFKSFLFLNTTKFYLQFKTNPSFLARFVWKWHGIKVSLSKNCYINASFHQKWSLIAQLNLKYCISLAFKTNTSSKNCIKKPLIWDQDELSSSSGSRDMRSSFVAVVKNHTVINPTCFQFWIICTRNTLIFSLATLALLRFSKKLPR